MWTLTALLVLEFALQGGAKLAGTPGEIAAFERWGYPDWFRLVVGVLEVAGVLGLLLPPTRFWAAAGLCGLMVGAIATHPRVGEFVELVLPVVTLGMAVTLAVLVRPELVRRTRA